EVPLKRNVTIVPCVDIPFPNTVVNSTTLTKPVVVLTTFALPRAPRKKTFPQPLEVRNSEEPRRAIRRFFITAPAQIEGHEKWPKGNSIGPGHSSGSEQILLLASSTTRIP